MVDYYQIADALVLNLHENMLCLKVSFAIRQ